MKNRILNVVEIVLSAITFPLWFVKLFVGIGHLPNQSGEIVEVVFRHSMYENICDGVHPFLAYITMAVMSSAIVLNIVNIKFNNKKLQIISNIVFGVAIGLFFVLLLYASTLGRGY
jgi:hypothetical protein